jgi:hypothetical protein
MLILKPDGLYYRYLETYKSNIDEKLKTDDWSPFIERYNQDLIELPKYSRAYYINRNRPVKRGKGFVVPRTGNKDKIREAFEENSLSQRISYNCYSFGY